MLIQIYEIQEPEEAERMIDLGVDHIGSVLIRAVSGPRTVLHDTIRLVQSSGARSCLIPLFTDPDDVSRALDDYRPDIVHFCSTLSDADGTNRLDPALALQEIIRRRFPEIGVMRSIPIPPPGLADDGLVLSIARQFEPLSDYFLTDTVLRTGDTPMDAEQPVSGFIGITGRTCDWNAAARLVQGIRIPVILAGGVSPENVADGIRQVRPAGVDSCTLTNAVGPDGRPVRFRKDRKKVKALVDSVRAATKKNG